MKKLNFLKIALALMCFVLVINSNAFAQPTVGSGSADDPYQIASVDDVKAMISADTGSYFLFVADIDYAGANQECLWTKPKKDADGNVLIPAPGSFKGYVDGAGHYIKNMAIKTQGWLKGSGFFFKLEGSCTNLHFENATCDDPSSDSPVGIVAGVVKEGSSITNCSVMNATVNGNVGVGVIAGQAEANSIIKDCNVYKPFAVTATSDKGDVVGIADASATIQDNTVEGAEPAALGSKDNPYPIATIDDIKAMGAKDTGSYFLFVADIDYAGANQECLWTKPKKDADGNVLIPAPGSFKGYVDGASHYIKNVNIKTQGWLKGSGFFFRLEGSVTDLNFENITCADPTSDSPVGAITGTVWPGSSITNCTVTAATIEGNDAVGIIAGYADSLAVVTNNEVKLPFTLTAAGDKGNVVGKAHANATVADNKVEGEGPVLGSKENPYLIATIDDIKAMGSKDLGSYFKFVADIDFDGATQQPLWTGAKKDADGNVIVAAPGCFQGFIDGNGKTIKNIVYSNTGWLSGGTGFFFRFKGTCNDLHFENVTSVYEGKENVGTITGHLFTGSSITNCTVKNVTVTGESAVGALVGRMDSASVLTGNAVIPPYTVTSNGDKGDFVGVAHADATVANNMIATEGTKYNPFLISTIEDIAAMGAKDTGSYFKFVADIDYAGATQQPLWTKGKKDADGNEIYPAPGSFYGYVDGNGHYIKNVVYTNTGWLSAGTGFFFKLKGSCSNLNFENVTSEYDGKDNVGVVTGYLLEGSTVSNCDITNASVKGNNNVAGVCGLADTLTVVENCDLVDVDVVGVENADAIVGAGNGEIVKCTFTGTINGEDYVVEAEEVVVTIESESFIAYGGDPSFHNTQSWGIQEAIGVYAPAGASADSAVNFWNNGDWAEYVVTIPEDGEYAYEYWTGCKNPNANIQISIDGAVAGIDSVPQNGDVNVFVNWKGTYTSMIKAGEHTIKLEGVGNDWQYNHDKFTLTKVGEYRDAAAVELVVEAESMEAFGGDNSYHWPADWGIEDAVGIYTADSANNVVATNFLNNGDWMEYTIDFPEDGTYAIEYFTGCKNDASNVRLYVDGTYMGVDAVPNNGSVDVFVGFKAETQIAVRKGEHKVMLMAVGGDWQFNTDKFILTRIDDYKYIAPANSKPVAEAGARIEVTEGDDVTLDASASTDPDGDELTYLWTAPDGITLDDVTAQKPSFTSPEVESMTVLWFELIVNDGIIDSDVDKVKVTVLNKTGVANFDAFAVNIYPNPSNGVITIAVENDAQVYVRNLTGAKVYAGQVGFGANKVDLSSLKSGQYFVSVVEGSKVVTKSILIK